MKFLFLSLHFFLNEACMGRLPWFSCQIGENHGPILTWQPAYLSLWQADANGRACSYGKGLRNKIETEKKISYILFQ